MNWLTSFFTPDGAAATIPPISDYSQSVMSTLNISLPESIRQRVETMAREDGVSVDSLVATILSQRIAVADADSYVRRRGSGGSAQQLMEILSLAPQIEPESHDRLQAG
jgi:hypothetical protein